MDSVTYFKTHGAHKPGITMDEIAEYYSDWADRYETDLSEDIYNGPLYACKTVADSFPSEMNDRSSVKIIDIACGTGFLGARLKTEGFTDIDGLDPSQNMLDVAKSKNAYKTLYREFLSEEMLPIKNDTYDCAVTSGGMGEGHIPCAGFYELIRIVKPGGYIIISMRELYLASVKEYAGKFDQFCHKLETESKWSNCSRTTVPNFYRDNKGVVYKFQVC